MLKDCRRQTWPGFTGSAKIEVGSAIGGISGNFCTTGEASPAEEEAAAAGSAAGSGAERSTSKEGGQVKSMKHEDLLQVNVAKHIKTVSTFTSDA